MRTAPLSGQASEGGPYAGFTSGASCSAVFGLGWVGVAVNFGWLLVRCGGVNGGAEQLGGVIGAVLIDKAYLPAPGGSTLRRAPYCSYSSPAHSVILQKRGVMSRLSPCAKTSVYGHICE